MENIKIIPHFHGISFCDINIQNREGIFDLYRNGNMPYYSKMIFKNASLDPDKKLSEYDVKLIEDFYLAEVENVFNNRNIMTQDDFFEFSRHYVNSYEKYIMNGKGTYLRNIKEKMKNLGLNSDKSYDPFVPTSKFPLHPIKFAINDNDIENFGEQFELFQNRDTKYLLLGMVFCSFYYEEEYNQELKHDIPQIKHIKDVKYKPRYLYQTEVDFYKINPQNFKFAFPILLIKDNIAENDKRDIMTKFSLNEDEYNIILECPYRKKCKRRTYVGFRKIFENIYKNYSKLILRKAKSLLNVNERLYYVNPANESVEIEDENMLSDYINDVHILSLTNAINGTIIEQQPQRILDINDLKNRFITVKNDIFEIIKEKGNLEEARKLLSEKVSEEKYETVCASRIVLKLANDKNTIEKNDVKVAQILQKREDRRYRDMIKNKQVNLGEFFESIGI